MLSVDPLLSLKDTKCDSLIDTSSSRATGRCQEILGFDCCYIASLLVHLLSELKDLT